MASDRKDETSEYLDIIWPWRPWNESKLYDWQGFETVFDFNTPTGFHGDQILDVLGLLWFTPEARSCLNRVTCHSSTLRQKFLKRAESYKIKQNTPDSCSLALTGWWGISNSWTDNLCPKVRTSVVEGGLQWQNQEEEVSPLVTDSAYAKMAEVSRASNAA